MNYEIKRSFRKTIAIKVADGAVIVYAPYFVAKKTLDDFVEKKRSWIEKRLTMYRPVGIDITKDSNALIFGEWLKIERFEGLTLELVLGSTLQVYQPTNTSAAVVNTFIHNELKRTLDIKIKRSLEIMCQALKLNIPSYTIRKYKRIYGRCSSNGTLGFNTYLYHEPLDFIDYVVLHECAHLIEFNHSPMFYKVIERVMPNYKDVIASQKRIQDLRQDQ